MDNENKIPNFSLMKENLIKNLRKYAGGQAVKFFKESFVNQGFTNKAFTPWQKTSNPLAGKRTLYKQGVLMQSVRKVREDGEHIVIESDTPYSQIHNEGGEITVTKAMKAHFWKLYYEFAGKVKVTKKEEISQSKKKNSKTKKKFQLSQSKANLKVNAKAEFCKKMALMKVGSKIKIPQRQFMGHSDAMMKQFEEWYLNEIDRQFKENIE
jgi:phage gpG-like protein